jgi:hypothetical protein
MDQCGLSIWSSQADGPWRAAAITLLVVVVLTYALLPLVGDESRVSVACTKLPRERWLTLRRCWSWRL